MGVLEMEQGVADLAQPASAGPPHQVRLFVWPLGGEADLDEAGCGLALAALEVTQALADIGVSFAGPFGELKVPGSGQMAQIAQD